MPLAILLIHYHTPALAAEAVEALRRDLAASDLPAEIVVVDNGSDAAGREQLAALPVRLVEPGENLGYAGGINRGLGEVTGDPVVVMNPDVLVEPGCLAALAASLRAGAAAAGPRFFLDRGRRLIIPPTELRRRRDELAAALAARGESWASRVRHRWRRHARRHWCAREPLPSLALSGALLAFTRAACERVGPFDQELRLYFEEDDWLHRLARRGLEARYVPAAEAVHLYNRSAGAEARAREWFAASRERFQRRAYGAWFVHLLNAASPGGELTLPPPLPAGPPRLDLGGSPESPAGALWVELATSRLGFPAAAERLEPGFRGIWELPAEVWAELGPGEYVLQVVEEDGAEVSRHSFVKERGA